MRIHAVATDFDGTLAHNGIADPEALDALRRLRKSGRKSILVTGRILADLGNVFGDLQLFDAVVAENGAVLHDPVHRTVRRIATPPPTAFVDALRTKGVEPLDTGDVIVATWHPNEDIVTETIGELGLDLAVVFNKGAVMVLPSDVTKATGLAAQVDDFGLSLHNVAGIGDAENDLAFLARCEVSAATGNALASVKNACDVVMAHSNGRGVAEFVDRIIRNDLLDVTSLQEQHAIALGTTDGDETVMLPATAQGVLLAGTSGGGKTTLVSAVLERLGDQRYQFCVLDPEGDYGGVDGVIPIGDEDAAPNLDTVASAVKNGDNVVMSLLAVAQTDRPAFAHRILARLAELQASQGRPHWCVVDEAHHTFPAQAEGLVPIEFGGGMLLITTRPELVAAPALAPVEIVIAVGDDPTETIAEARRVLGVPDPPVTVGLDHAHTGTAVVWKRAEPSHAVIIDTVAPRRELRRHVRKYAEGELAPEKSFYFTGPDGKQHLRAQNLTVFAQLADGVDDETWEYHRKRNDYSEWMRDAIGDEDLDAEVHAIEDDATLDARTSRDRVIAAVRDRYTLPG